MTEPRETTEPPNEQSADSYAEIEENFTVEPTPSLDDEPQPEQDELSYAREEPGVDLLGSVVPPGEAPLIESQEQGKSSYAHTEPVPRNHSDGEPRTNVINSAVSDLQASHVQAVNSAFQKAQVETLTTRQSAIALAQSTNATISQSGVGVVVAQDRVNFSQGGGVVFAAGKTLSVAQGGGSILAAGNKLNVNMGGGFILAAGNEIEVEKGGGGLLLAGNKVEVEESFVGIILSPNVKLKKGATVLLNTPQAAALGVAFGAAFALVRWLLQRQTE